MKRSSNKDLNHENWNDEEKPEERGNFSSANNDIISQRKIISINRNSESKLFPNLQTNSQQNSDPNNNREKHLKNVKQLNKTFLEKIQQFTNENDCCILLPLFDDYKRHLLTINTKYPLSNHDLSNTTSNDNNNDVKSIFKSSDNENPIKNQSSLFNFKSNTSEIPKIEFSSQLNTSNSLFGDKNKGNVQVVENEEEDYVPPKPESRDIKEADSVYDVRCKMYYQSDKEWKDRGVGNLFIKPLSGGKCQLVMRADNSLGTILLNVLFTDKMPLTVTKNNVNIVVMTDFVSKESQPTPLLLRLKTADDADQLIKAIKNQIKKNYIDLLM